MGRAARRGPLGSARRRTQPVPQLDAAALLARYFMFCSMPNGFPPPNGAKAREVTREPYASLKRLRSFSMTPNYYGGLATAKSGTRRRSLMSATLWPKLPSYVILGSRVPMYCFSLHAWGALSCGSECSRTPCLWAKVA